MPSVQLPYENRYDLIHELSHKEGFCWLSTQTKDEQSYEIVAYKPQWHKQNLSEAELLQIEEEFLKNNGERNTSLDLFNGGLLGYISYDFGRQLSQNSSTHRHHSGQYPNEDNHLPSSLHIAYYPTNYWVIDHSSQTIKGHAEEAPCLEDLKQVKASKYFELSSCFETVWSKQQYLTAFNKIKDYILSGDCYQVNLTHRHQARYNGDPFAAFCRVIKHHRTPHFAYMPSPTGQVLCFSPESFLSIDGHEVWTKPIKGSRKRSPHPEQDSKVQAELLSSAKDRAENVMIVDLLRNDLGRISKPGTVTVEKLCSLESFSNVHHLESTVKAELREDMTPLKALLACSPGGSITGAPKIRSMEIIEELESFPRSAYCGSIFSYSHCGRLESNIAIRTMVCRNGQATIWGGGGIVADSVGQDEYEESLFKIRHIIGVLEETIE